MSRRAAVGLSVFIVAFAVLIVVSAMVSGAANFIDNVHWEGNPLPPCFVDAKTCGGHLLGTDEVGRDIAARLVVGTRTTLVVSLFALSCEVAVALGLALLGRHIAPVRSAVSHVAAAISSISPWPYLLIISFFSFKRVEPILGGLWLALWAGTVCWPALWRLMSDILSPKPIMQKAARDWCALIFVFTTIDFFGYGIQPPLASLGNMLSTWQQDMGIAWWAVAFPAAALVLVVFAVEIVSRLVAQRLPSSPTTSA